MSAPKPDALTEEFLRESNHIENEYSEQAYKDALIAWNFLMRKDILNVDVVMRTHKMLMKNRDTLKESEKGNIRNCDVWIGRHKGMDVPLLAGEIWKWCFEMMRVDPKPDWKALHVRYEKAHVFVDGNGRTGRMFMNWLRVKRLGLPVLVIRESEKYDYYKWFN